jgi:hypothetical protein
MMDEMWSWYQPNSEKLMSIIASFDKVNIVFVFLLSQSYIIGHELHKLFTGLPAIRKCDSERHSIYLSSSSD